MSTLTALSEILDMEKETVLARLSLYYIEPQIEPNALEQEDDYFGTR